MRQELQMLMEIQHKLIIQTSKQSLMMHRQIAVILLSEYFTVITMGVSRRYEMCFYREDRLRHMA